MTEENAAVPLATTERPGDGAPVVLLHGGTVAGWMWQPQFTGAPGLRLIVPDLPGFGDSNGQPWPGLEGAADRIAALIRDRAHGRAHLVGLSLGASVAIEVAVRHPDVVGSLLLASASVVRPSLPVRMLARGQLAVWNRVEYWRGSARAMGLTDPDEVGRFVATGLGISRSTAEQVAREVTAGVPAERLGRIAVPTLAVAGGADARHVRDGSLRHLDAHVAGIRVAVAPRLHHAWSAEDPALFDEVLAASVTGSALPPALVPLV